MSASGGMVPTDVAGEGRIRSPRFTQWLLFLIISIVAMSSAIEVVERNHENAIVMNNQKYAVASTITSLLIIGIVVLMHLSSVTSLFIVNTKLEGFVCLVLLALHSATVAVISDPGNGLAVDANGAVMNGNLYYFTWAGFVLSIVIFVSFLRSVYHVDVAGEIRSRSARLNHWAWLLAASLVVMGASANIYDADCNVEPRYQTEKFCNRTAFGIAVGSSGVVASLLVVGLKIATTTAPFKLEILLSVVICIIDAFGVAYITSSYGPGAPLGNLYYFTWGSFAASLMLLSSCYEEYTSEKKDGGRQKDERFSEEEEEGDTGDF